MKPAPILLAAALSLIASTSSAATVTISEGIRAPILGSLDLGDVKGSPSKAYDAGDYGSGDTLNIHGRMVSKIDTFAFSMANAFSVSFIFGGFETENGLSRSSGFTAEKRTDNTSVFRLLDANDPTRVITERTFTTGITSEDDNGGNALIFAADAGDYLFQIDGSVFNNRRTPALYDVQISAVPVPASAWLLLAGLGALGVAGRRTRRT